MNLSGRVSRKRQLQVLNSSKESHQCYSQCWRACLNIEMPIQDHISRHWTPLEAFRCRAKLETCWPTKYQAWGRSCEDIGFGKIPKTRWFASAASEEHSGAGFEISFEHKLCLRACFEIQRQRHSFALCYCREKSPVDTECSRYFGKRDHHESRCAQSWTNRPVLSWCCWGLDQKCRPWCCPEDILSPGAEHTLCLALLFWSTGRIDTISWTLVVDWAWCTCSSLRPLDGMKPGKTFANLATNATVRLMCIQLDTMHGLVHCSMNSEDNARTFRSCWCFAHLDTIPDHIHICYCQDDIHWSSNIYSPPIFEKTQTRANDTFVCMWFRELGATR